MTLSEIISQYVEEHSMNEFLKDSGLSRTYTYMLMRNKNRNGSPITPSVETVRKVARGIHSSFHQIIGMLDDDYIRNLGHDSSMPEEYAKMYELLPIDSKIKINVMIHEEYEKNKSIILEYDRLKNQKELDSIDEAKAYLEYSSSFGDSDLIIETLNKAKKKINY